MAKGRKMTAKQKSARAVELYNLGWTYEEIAPEVGYRDRSGAYRAVERAIAEQIREPAEHVRRAEVARLDMLLKATFAVLYRDHYVVNAGKIVHRIVEYQRTPDGGIAMDEEGNPIAAELEILHDDKPKLEAVDRILKIMARRARLLGLDAPTQFEAVHPDLIRSEMDSLQRELGMSDAEVEAFNAEAGRLIEQWADSPRDD